jgi:anaerobic magnesium-protoporphyrin IX monomethyl ester cyclase
LRVLLLNPPADKLYLRDFYCGTSTKANYFWPPTDLIVLSGALAKDHDVKALDANVMRLTKKRTMQIIMRMRPDAIFFLTSAISLHNDMGFMQQVKTRLGCRIYGSGDLLFFKPRLIMDQFDYLDGILMNFCTQSVNALLAGDMTNLEDIIYRMDGKIVQSQASTGRLLSYPMPRHELFPLRRYSLPFARESPMTVMMTHFGCPFRCNFCASNQLGFKERSVQDVLAELQYIHNLGIKEIYFKDFTYGLNRHLTEEILNKMIYKRLRLSWSVTTRADVMDEKLLTLMKKAGCHTILVGVESGDAEILDSTGKRVSIDRMRSVFDACNKIGITTLAHFIIGFPNDTEKSIARTIDLAKELKIDYASFNLYVPRFGSTLRDQLLSDGAIQDDTDSLELDSSFDIKSISDALDSDKLKDLKKKAYLEFYLRPSQVWRILRTIRSPAQMTNIVSNGMSVILNNIGMGEG